jgi:hypothetical protein
MRSLTKTSMGIVAAALLLVGCDNDNEVTLPGSAAPGAKVRVIHASADAPNVNVIADGANIATDLAFKQATAFQDVAAGPVSVRVDGILPSGTVTVIGPVDLTLAASTAYSIVAIGDVSAIRPLVISDTAVPPSAGNVRARVVHAAPDAPAVDVYLTAPTALLEQSVSLGRLAFAEQTASIVAPAGEYRIRVTLANDATTVVFDSGTVSLPAGADLLVAAVTNVGPGDAPISLVASTGTSTLEILDAATQAELRVIHASPDAPAVDVVVNDNFASPALEDVPFPAVSGYLAVPPGTYNVKVTPANTPGVIVIDADVSLAAGKRYSVYATGPLAAITPYVLIDDDRRVSTAAKVRIVHAAPGAGSVDIYVTAPGAGIEAATPAFSNVPLRAETGYVSLAAGSYDVTVTPAGTKTAAIGPATITVFDGNVYTAAARDAVGGGAPFGLILLDDFAF